MTEGAGRARQILVDNTDWLKAAAIALVCIDHVGAYLVEDELWWRAFGRMAAPAFFFLIGYAHSTRIPATWIVLGIVLTVADAWFGNWQDMFLNILLNLALIRFVRPHVYQVLVDGGWVGFALTALLLISLFPLTNGAIEYSSEGWLWALVGLYQRAHTDRLARGWSGSATADVSSIRLVACAIAAVCTIYWQDKEFMFHAPQYAVLVIGIACLAVAFVSFRRGPSPVQPGTTLAPALRFIGHHTLEIYAANVLLSILVAKLLLN